MAKLILYRLDEIKDVTPPPFLGKNFRFTFSTSTREIPGIAEQDEKIRQYEINILIGIVLRNSWSNKNSKLKDDQNLVKILYNYAKTNLFNILEKGEDKSYKETLLTWNEELKICPYDPDKITMDIGEWHEIEIPTKIGFM